MNLTAPVVCPSCFETFEVPLPPPGETEGEIDYDCEVCCHPMVIAFEETPTGEIAARARGLAE